MKTIARTFWKMLFCGVLLALLFACEGQRQVEFVQTASMREAVAAGGWERTAKRMNALIPASLWLENSAKLYFGRTVEVNWQAQRERDAWLVEASAKLESIHLEWEFAVNKGEKSPRLLEADAVLAYRMERLKLADHPFTPVARVQRIERSANGDWYFSWEGCLMNHGLQPIEQIELRASLLVDGPDGRLGAVGQARHTTARSGIPKTVQADAFFCTTLRSGRLSSGVIGEKPEQVLGVVEAHWIDSVGLQRIGPIVLEPLAWTTETEYERKGYAIVNGGELKALDSEKVLATLPVPALVSLQQQRGSRLQVRSTEGIVGLIEQEQVLAEYPRTRVDLDPAVKEQIQKLLTLLLTDRAEAATAMFDERTQAERHGELLRDLHRRVDVPPALEVRKVTIHPLNVQRVYGLVMVEYFAWIELADGNLWRSYDVLLYTHTAKGPRFTLAPSNASPKVESESD